jgi:predicted MFS family arabinose efflux permease
VRQYLLVTGNYWAFTLTDGALRMLVVLHFHRLGYSPLEVAMLFLFYEVFGIVTNLVGGWLGARIGLNRTMNIGLALQVAALSMLLVPASMLAVPWVMAAQALSGVAKDLNKMSAKSSIKLLVPRERPGALFRWVALLTGSKNALKGAGFFLGGTLLATLGFRAGIAAMALALLGVWLASVVLLRRDLGRSRTRPPLRQMVSRSGAINRLSAARMFLFGARDVWFVVALPVFLADRLGWDVRAVGGFLAAWVIGYGLVQSLVPVLTRTGRAGMAAERAVMPWGLALALVPLLMAAVLAGGGAPGVVVVAGLALFGVLFAINSALHSYLVLAYARHDGVSLDVGFYYMANAFGRLLGTLLSGAVYQAGGLVPCLVASGLLLALAAAASVRLPQPAGAAAAD